MTLKCLPMSRRNSITDIGAVQSWLLTIRAAAGPSKSRNALELAADAARTSSRPRLRSFSVRSPVGLGSPIMPVAPPTSASGRWPASWKRRSGQGLGQVPDVQAGGGRVEAAVERDRARGQLGAQGVQVGAVGDQPAPGEVVEDRRPRSKEPGPVGGRPSGRSWPALSRTPVGVPRILRHGRSAPERQRPAAGAADAVGTGLSAAQSAQVAVRGAQVGQLLGDPDRRGPAEPRSRGHRGFRAEAVADLRGRARARCRRAPRR